MNIMRIGFVSLIIGLILLLNASSSHMAGRNTYSYDVLAENETQRYAILIAPVGVANLTIGLQQSFAASGLDPTFDESSLPEGFNRYDLTGIPVHVQVYDPNNQTLAEQENITPYTLEIVFKTRGSYKVYVTNKGTEKSTIPVTVEFKLRDPQNREADKFLLSIVLTALGTAIIVVGFVINFVSKHRQQHKP